MNLRKGILTIENVIVSDSDGTDRIETFNLTAYQIAEGIIDSYNKTEILRHGESAELRKFEGFKQ